MCGELGHTPISIKKIKVILIDYLNDFTHEYLTNYMVLVSSYIAQAHKNIMRSEPVRHPRAQTH